MTKKVHLFEKRTSTECHKQPNESFMYSTKSVVPSQLMWHLRMVTSAKLKNVPRVAARWSVFSSSMMMATSMSSEGTPRGSGGFWLCHYRALLTKTAESVPSKQRVTFPSVSASSQN